MSGLHSLTSMDLISCEKLSSLGTGISAIVSLCQLNIRDCGQLDGLPEGISSLFLLTSLRVHRCYDLASPADSISGLVSFARAAYDVVHRRNPSARGHQWPVQPDQHEPV